MTSAENSSVKAQADSPPFGLDEILAKIGNFGKFQLVNYLMLFVPVLFTSIIAFSIAFTASPVVYRCRIPDCDGSNSQYEESWTEFSIPKKMNGDLEKCHRYVPFNKSHAMGICNAESFDHDVMESCEGDFIFRDHEKTISTDFGILCSDEWKLQMAGTINNFGQFLGIPLGGLLSDRFGRRTVLAFGGFLSALAGLLRSFSPSYIIFLIFGFLDNLFGASLFPTVFILGLELVGPKLRVPACTVLTMTSSVSACLLALVAKYYPNWRIIERIFYIPALSIIGLLWLLPESVRWLLSQGREKEATEIIKRAAVINKRKLSDVNVEKLLEANRQSLVGADTNKFPIKEAFSYFPWRIVKISLCWFANVLVFFGLNLNAALLGGSKYDSFMYAALIEIPGFVLPFLTMNRYGRRLSLFAFMFMCGISIAATIFVSSESLNIQLALFLLGKMGITASFNVLYFFTSEIFPTSVRNSLLSFCSMFGRFGSILAPQTPLMARYNKSAPAILFSAVAISTGFLAFLLPETTNVTLPTTLEEAGQIGQKAVVETEPETKEKLLDSKA